MANELAEVSEQGRQGFARMWRHLEPYLYHGTAWTLLAGYLFEASDYLLPLLRDESVAGRQKLLAVHELLVVALRLAKRFEVEENQQAALLKHLRFLRTCGQEKALRVSGDDAELDGVRLMTVHRSKGLEFPIVYLPNLVKGQFPPKKQGRMVSPPAAMAERVDRRRRRRGEQRSGVPVLCRPVPRSRHAGVVAPPDMERQTRAAKPPSHGLRGRATRL